MHTHASGLTLSQVGRAELSLDGRYGISCALSSTQNTHTHTHIHPTKHAACVELVCGNPTLRSGYYRRFPTVYNTKYIICYDLCLLRYVQTEEVYAVCTRRIHVREATTTTMTRFEEAEVSLCRSSCRRYRVPGSRGMSRRGGCIVVATSSNTRAFGARTSPTRRLPNGGLVIRRAARHCPSNDLEARTRAAHPVQK